MADIDALLGLRGGSGADTKALARELRGQSDLGDFLGMSTIKPVADLGDTKRKRAVAAATRAGRLRDAIAARKQRRELADRRFEYDQGRDEIADSRYADELAYDRRQTFGAAETFQTPGGDTIQLQRAEGGPDEGRYFDAATGTPHDITAYSKVAAPSRSGSGGSGYTSGALKKDGYGNSVYRDGNTTRFADGADWSEREAARRAQSRGGVTAGVEGGEAEAKASGKERVERRAATREARGVFKQTRSAIQDAIQAIDDGANTGAIVSTFVPTLTAATARLENAQQRLGLQGIADYTFGSLSEAEGRWLRETAINLRQDPADLRASLVKRLEGIERMEEANNYVAQELDRGREPDFERIDEILYGGGFSFTDPPLGRGGGEADTPGMPGMPDMPDGVRAVIDSSPDRQRRFNALTPEQQRIFIEDLEKEMAGGG